MLSHNVRANTIFITAAVTPHKRPLRLDLLPQKGWEGSSDPLLSLPPSQLYVILLKWQVISLSWDALEFMDGGRSNEDGLHLCRSHHPYGGQTL